MSVSQTLLFGTDAQKESALKHGIVPLVETIATRSLLVWRMAPEDEVVSPMRRTGPYVGCPESAHLTPLQVANEHLVIDTRARLRWPEEFHTVQVAYIDAIPVWFRTVIAVLLYVHAEEINIHTINPLEQQDTLLPIGHLLGQFMSIVVTPAHTTIVHSLLVRCQREIGAHSFGNFQVFVDV